VKQKNRAPVNWMLRAASILLCLVLVSSYLVCGMFARYTTSASGSDSARVAKFEIQETGVSTISLNDPISPGEKVTRTLTVQNKSEVAVEYEVTVVNQSGNLPLKFYVDGSNATENPVKRTLKPMAVEDVLHEYSLVIEWPDTLTSADLAGLVDHITVSVSATQID